MVNDDGERMAAVEKIIDMERILFAIKFPASGSIYFKSPLMTDLQQLTYLHQSRPGRQMYFVLVLPKRISGVVRCEINWTSSEHYVRDFYFAFSVRYPESKAADCLDIGLNQQNVDAQMQQLRDFIGVNIDGWVRTESHEEAREKECYIRQQMLETAETEAERRELRKHWPFQDPDELN